MEEISVSAKLSNIPIVTGFVNKQLRACGCPKRIKTQINITVDEIFCNIVRYAFPSGDGTVTAKMDVSGQPLTMTLIFIDQGRPYNPLNAPLPDTSLKARQRKIGGLGIYMVKNLMDEIIYDNQDGKNILTIRKQIHPSQDITYANS